MLFVLRKTIIGVMGPGDAPTKLDLSNARKLGEFIAKQGWVLLTGGRNAGVMDEASKGAKQAGGLVIGILPTNEPDKVSQAVDIAIITGMGSARNAINVLSSDVVIACGMGAGTASEIALALKAKKQVILLSEDDESKAFFKKLGKDKVHVVQTAEQAVELAKKIVSH